jgi:hypothetical protein
MDCIIDCIFAVDMAACFRTANVSNEGAIV